MVSDTSSKAFPTLFFGKMLLVLCISFIIFAGLLLAVFVLPYLKDEKVTEIEIHKNEPEFRK